MYLIKIKLSLFNIFKEILGVNEKDLADIINRRRRKKKKKDKRQNVLMK